MVLSDCCEEECGVGDKFLRYLLPCSEPEPWRLWPWSVAQLHSATVIAVLAGRSRAPLADPSMIGRDVFESLASYGRAGRVPIAAVPLGTEVAIGVRSTRH
jgi:hypothetical protein